MTQSASEQTKEPDIVEQLDKEIAVCRKHGWPQTEAFLGAAKAEITRLRAERPGWREALEELITARDMLGRAHSSGTQSGIERAEKRMFRAWDDGRAALHPSVAEGRQPKDEKI